MSDVQERADATRFKFYSQVPLPVRPWPEAGQGIQVMTWRPTIVSDDIDDGEPETYPFPAEHAASQQKPQTSQADSGESDSDTDSIRMSEDALEHVNRRMEDLARRLKVLGHFRDDDDGPKAA